MSIYMTSKDWMSGAVKRPGVFTAKARRAGKSTQGYANDVINRLKGKTKTEAQRRLLRQAVLAKTFGKFRPKKRK